MLFQTLLDVLVRREEHLARFDEVLHGIFDSEGDDPLVGHVFPDSTTLDTMLTRLEQATDRFSPREPWVKRGISLLRGEFKKESGSVPANPILETVTANANETEAGSMEVEVEPVAFPMTESTGPSAPSEE